MPQRHPSRDRILPDTVRPLALAVLTLGLAFASWRGDAWVPLISHVDLGVHELGHLLAFWMPPVGAALAGSGLQLLTPASLAAYFGLLRRDVASAVVLVAWLGVSVRSIAAYMADSNVRALPLLGGQDGHDWAFIFGQWGLLDHAESIAGVFSAMGWMVFVAALYLAAVEYVKPRAAARKAEALEAHRRSLPVRDPNSRSQQP